MSSMAGTVYKHWPGTRLVNIENICYVPAKLVFLSSWSTVYHWDFGRITASGAVLEVRWRFCDLIAVTGWLFIEPMGKVSSWIFNWDRGGICKTRLSGKFPTIGEQKVDSREGVAQKLLVRCRKVVEVVVHDLLQPLRVPRRVGFTLEMPKWINRCHRVGSSLETAIDNKIDCKICLE